MSKVIFNISVVIAPPASSLRMSGQTSKAAETHRCLSSGYKASTKITARKRATMKMLSLETPSKTALNAHSQP